LWFVFLVLVALGTILLYPPSRSIALGWIRQEPFFEGRPRSYWADELKEGRAPSVPVLVVLLDDGDAGVRQRAAKALAEQRSGAREAVTALSRTLKDADKDVRWSSAYALSSIGPDARAAVPDLLQILKDPEDGVRQQAALSLGNLASDNPAAVPALTTALHDSAPGVRQAAAASLARMGLAAKPAVPALAASLRDRDEDTRRQAALTLGELGPTAREAVPALIAAFANKQEQPDLRGVFLTALIRLKPSSAELIPLLIQGITDSNITIQITSVVTLGDLGPQAREAVPALKALVKGRLLTPADAPRMGPPSLVDEVVRALKKIDPKAVPQTESPRSPAARGEQKSRGTASPEGSRERRSRSAGGP
jgi:HEAT repeat protein